MNAFIKSAIIAALFAATSFCASAQTATPNEATATAVVTPSVDLPKELKGKWYGWSRGSRVAKDVIITFLDVQNQNSIKGVIVFDDKEGCPAFSLPTSIEKLVIVGKTLTIETPVPQSCIESPTAVGAKLFMKLRLEKDGATWSAKGEGTVESPARTFRVFEVQTTSP